MIQFSARNFYQIGRLLERVKNDYSLALSESSGADGVRVYSSAPNARLTKKDAEGLELLLKAVNYHCEHIGLNLSAMHIQRMRNGLSENKTNQDIVHELNELDARIRDEMLGRLFFGVSPHRSAFYLEPERDSDGPGPKILPLWDRREKHFGKRVQDKFPSTMFDFEEAGKCLAFGRATACVFHLMRVLELALGVLGSKFGVSLAHTNWNPAIEQIESKIRDMRKDPAWKVLPDCKEQQEFYAQAASHFGVLKDAWRNHTMHSRGKYTEEEAEQIFANVRSFLQKLAERLSE